MFPKISIVIVGSGFAGVACAKECACLFCYRPDVTITLVSPRPYHDFHPALYEVATAVDIGTKEPRTSLRFAQTVRGRLHNLRTNEQLCLRKAVCLPLSEIFSKTKVRLVHGTVRAVNKQERFVSLTHGEHIFYTYLVLALGSMTEYYQIPGLREHALVLNDIESALRMRREVMRELRKPHPASPYKGEEVKEGMRGRVSLRIAIGGGGFTGTELAAELSHCLRRLQSPISNLQVLLIEGSTAPVSQLGEQVSQIARERLSALGVRLVRGRIEKVARLIPHALPPRKRGEMERGVEITLDNGESIKANFLIWTGGVRGNQLYEHLFPYSIGSQGRVTVEPGLQVAGEERIFAIGDGAYFTDDTYQNGLPMQAQIAVAQGRQAAQNIVQHLHGRALTSFKPPAVSYIVPLGGRYAVAKLRERWIFGGLIPWILKQLIELRYYCSLLGFSKGFRAWVGMEKICVGND